MTPIDGATIHPHASVSGPSGRDVEAIKARQQAAWAAGDYGQIGVRLQIVGESICEAVDLHSTDRVLDVAAGNGNASLAAARRFAHVTSTDNVPALLEAGRRRAEGEQLPVTFRVADAEALPFADASFDVALSTFGVMFAANQERAAGELLRVVRPGGRIGMTNWIPDGFVGQFFDLVTRFAPPPAAVRSPLEWGTETRLVELFGPNATDIRTARRTYMFRFRSAEHWIAFFREHFGPTVKAFAGLDEARQRELHDALLTLAGRWNRAGNRSLVIPGDYLEVVLAR